MILAFCINIISYQNPDNAFLYALYTIIEAVAFFSFLHLHVQSPAVKKAALIVCAGFVVFNIFYPLVANDAVLVDSIPIGIETIIILVFSYYFLYERTNDVTTLYIYSTFPFWIVIGVVLYLSGSFFIYLFAASITESEVHQYWFITNLFSCLKNVLFAVGIVLNSKPPKTLPPSEFQFSSLN